MTITLDFDGHGWLITMDVVRLDATHATISVQAIMGNVRIDSGNTIACSGVQDIVESSNNIAVNNMDSSSNDIVLSAQSATATANNIVNNLAIVELTRF
jgi:hypothetical protein